MEDECHEIDDEDFLTYMMVSLPQEEYQATILTLNTKLSKDTLSIEEAEPLLDDKYEAMKEIDGWTEEGDELALLIGKPHFKKTLKGQCGYCGKYGHKAVDCLERKANQDRRKNKAHITGQEKGRFKPKQNKKPLWQQGDPRGKRKFHISKV